MKLFQFFCMSIAPLSAFALSFLPNTEFLDANTPSKCAALGGDFITWYDEVYCTRQLKTDDQNQANGLENLIGKTISEARELFPNRIMRIVSLDGQSLPVTKDYVPGRINLTIRHNLIIKFSEEGQEAQPMLLNVDNKGGKLSKCVLSQNGYQAYNNLCYFLPEKGNGGFSIYLADEKYFYENIAVINLWKTSKQNGEVSALRITDMPLNSRWGTVFRSKKDSACWVSYAKSMDNSNPEFEICVYAIK